MMPTHSTFEGEPMLVRYLLGLQPDGDTEQLDEAAIVDDDVAARLLDAETDLIDAYVAGALDPATRARFEAVYLASRSRRQRVDAARRFRAAVDALPRSGPPPGREWRRTWRLVGLTASAAAALLIAVILLYPDGVPAPRQAAPVAAPAADAIVASAEAIVLSPQTRAADAVQTIVLSGVQALPLDLRLDAPDAARYRAAVTDRSALPVWSSETLAPFSRNGSSFVSIRVPAAALTTGDYVVALSAVRDGGALDPVGNYLLRIERPDARGSAGP